MSANGSNRGSWIDSFLEYTDGVTSPHSFRRWSAISAVAAALERRVWTQTGQGIIYPNMFVLLVGPPGVGKSNAIKDSVNFLVSCQQFNIAPSALTKAALLDQLKSKTHTVMLPSGMPMIYHSIIVQSSEFGVLVPAHDLGFLNTLNELYDCNPVFEDRTRMHGLIKIDRPSITMIAGTQPKYLGELLPEAAFGMGFTSRVIMIYSAQEIRGSIFAARNRSTPLHDKLQKDLKAIGRLNGAFAWEVDAIAAIESWNKDGLTPVPTHLKLQHYKPRRLVHVMKLAMIHAASRLSLDISLEDFITARDDLLAAEAAMPEIFKEITSVSDASEIDEAFTFTMQKFLEAKRTPIIETQLIAFLAKRIPAIKVKPLIETMVEAGMLKISGQVLPGEPRRLIPGER